MKNTITKDITFCGLFIAITFLSTCINITLPLGIKGCLVHFGPAMLILSAYVLRPVHSGLSAGLGMAFYDLMGGWSIWAPFTFVIRFAQAFFISHMLKKYSDNKPLRYIGLVIGGLIDVVGYYLAESLIYSNWIVPFASMPAETINYVFGIIVGGALIVAYRKSHLERLL